MRGHNTQVFQVCSNPSNIAGSVLKEGDNRSKVFLCTKFGIVFDRKTLLMTGEIRGNLIVIYYILCSNADIYHRLAGDAAYIKQCIDESISRLGCTPDLYYQHRVDPKV